MKDYSNASMFLIMPLESQSPWGPESRNYVVKTRLNHDDVWRRRWGKMKVSARPPVYVFVYEQNFEHVLTQTKFNS